MKWFYDLRIATKLIISFSLVLLLTLIMGVTAIVSMGRINQASSDLSENWMPSVQAIMSIRTDVGDMRRWELAHILNDEAAGMAKYEASMGDSAATMKKDSERYAKLVSSPEEKTLYDQFTKLWDSYMADHAKIIGLSRLNQKTEARAVLTGSSLKTMGEMNQRINQLVKLNTDGGVSASDAATAIYVGARQWQIVLLVLNIGIGFALALWIARMVSRPLQEALALARDVADGDLTHDIEASTNCETGQLMQALSDMNKSLQSLVGQVRSGTDTITVASAQIAAGNQDLSSRTEQQASSLEETASSMEELTSTVKQNADNARQANVLARSASGIAVKGGDVVGQVVGTMASINASSRQIVDIISVIDGIAFQTNILALNAAVEAARAGEQGRGFAVVAGEVRNLAQRSAAAAKDIKTLINNSVEQVEAGSELVNQAGATMEEIVASITRVTDIMGEITAASQEQSTGIEQVNHAIVHMDQVTQQNAALVEEAAAAAESMQDQAAQLSQVVCRFKLSATMMAAMTPPPARRKSVARPPASVSVAAAVRPAPRPALAKAPAPKAAARPSLKQTVAADTSGDEWETF
ncbi:methyl-accepting chemotaxis protein [Rugamonas sp.]|uniref:methyl-accepting chemotaxis protein n=1 Tax=Rugamonas sp. TaxID=1926287 RepID=UPI0025F74128|nr:methyl-accepting chemotaxis protein [Rugamonas sp.]